MRFAVQASAAKEDFLLFFSSTLLEAVEYPPLVALLPFQGKPEVAVCPRKASSEQANPRRCRTLHPVLWELPILTLTLIVRLHFSADRSDFALVLFRLFLEAALPFEQAPERFGAVPVRLFLQQAVIEPVQKEEGQEVARIEAASSAAGKLQSAFEAEPHAAPAAAIEHANWTERGPFVVAAVAADAVVALFPAPSVVEAYATVAHLAASVGWAAEDNQEEAHSLRAAWPEAEAVLAEARPNRDGEAPNHANCPMGHQEQVHRKERVHMVCCSRKSVWESVAALVAALAAASVAAFAASAGASAAANVVAFALVAFAVVELEPAVVADFDNTVAAVAAVGRANSKVADAAGAVVAASIARAGSRAAVAAEVQVPAFALERAVAASFPATLARCSSPWKA